MSSPEFLASKPISSCLVLSENGKLLSGHDCSSCSRILSWITPEPALAEIHPVAFIFSICQYFPLIKLHSGIERARIWNNFICEHTLWGLFLEFRYVLRKPLQVNSRRFYELSIIKIVQESWKVSLSQFLVFLKLWDNIISMIFFNHN